MHIKSLYFSAILTLTIPTLGYSQKKDLDTTAFHNWPKVEGGALSPDGDYAYYTVVVETGYSRPQRTFVLKNLQTSWSGSFPNADIIGFNKFSPKLAFLQLPKDSIEILHLSSNSSEYISGVKEFHSQNNWIIYRLIKDDSLHVKNLKTGATLDLPGVQNIALGKKKNILVVQTLSQTDHYKLSLINLTDYNIKSFYEGVQATEWQWDAEEKELAFMAGKTGQMSIYLYRPDSLAAIRLISDADPKFEPGYRLTGISRFNSDGKYLLFNTEKSNTDSAKKTVSLADVYKYTDLKISFDKANAENPSRLYLHVVSLLDNTVHRIEDNGDDAGEDNGEFILILHRKEAYEWEEYLPGYRTYHLVRFQDGRKVDLTMGNNFWFSPSGDWLLYFDPQSSTYKVLNLRTLEIVPRSFACIKDTWIVKSRLISTQPYPIGIAGWINNGNSVLIYSRHGLWQISIDGREDPKLLTGIVESHQIQKYTVTFSLANGQDGDSIVLSGFNDSTKDEGFYQCVLGKAHSLVCLSKGAWCIRHAFFGGTTAVKAENSNTFLFRKMTAENSPNYYVTNDFKAFHAVSDIRPEGDYNWLTATLVHWRSLDGTPLMGVLYKPPGFDAKRKYPLIFHYYERLSDELHVYHPPAASPADLNIPYMVSQGYLVFTPDISYNTGYPGRSAYNSIVSAAAYLSHLSYVDTLHMGIEGYSFGGFETNYILTHTSVFAAACTGGGVFDLMMDYNDLRGNEPNQMFVEYNQYRMASPPWKAKDKYLNNELIFNIDHVKTPVLITHNWNDEAVDVHQGISLFCSLRRARKPVWLLQYPGQGHGLSKEVNRLDHTQKMLDFFNHFLKGMEEPSWMR